VAAAISNISPCENYVFKVKAVSAAGTVESTTLTFKLDGPKPTVSGVTATNISSFKEQLDGQVNANGVPTTVKCEYGKTNSYGQSVTATPPSVTGNTLTNVSVTLTGLDGGTKYYFRLTAESCGGTTYGEGSFTTDPSCVAPAISNLSVSNITATSATLKGKVNAQGFSTQVVFEYGETVSLGSFVDGSPSTVTGGSPTDVSATLTGLNAKKIIYWRIVAENCGGETKSDPLQQFETACLSPTIITASVTTTVNSAQLKGQVNANSFSTTVKFEYGETITYGSSITASPSPVTGNSNTSVSANISGLKVSTKC
jgi:phosphodiesterase/alkaline phosphatase D-like protein